MKTTFCKCAQCKHARKSRRAQASIKRVQRSAKREVREKLRNYTPEAPLWLPIRILAGYLG